MKNLISLFVIAGLVYSAACQSAESVSRQNASAQTKNEPKVNLCVNTKPPDDHTQMINFANAPLIQDVALLENGEMWFGTGDLSNEAFRSQNNGESWEKLQLQNIRSISAFNFINSRNGFLSDYEGNFYRTDDGGKSWAKITTDKSFAKKVELYGINKIKFTSPKNGFALSKTGEIYQTFDGGGNWKEIGLPSRAEYVAASFLDDKTVWIASVKNLNIQSNILYLTAKQSNGWKNYTVPGRSNFIPPISVFFYDQNHGWIASDTGILQATADSGKTWKQLDTETGKVSIRSMFWQNTEVGWLAGGNEQNQAALLKTDDGGKTWKSVLTKNEKFFTEVFFDSSKTGRLVSRDRIYKTVDNGETWDSIVTASFDCK